VDADIQYKPTTRVRKGEYAYAFSPITHAEAAVRCRLLAALSDSKTAGQLHSHGLHAPASKLRPVMTGFAGGISDAAGGLDSKSQMRVWCR
jgi:hypothetical protein